MADFSIPSAAIQKWASLPLEAPVILHLSREDVDRFFFAQVQIATAMYQFQQSVISLSNSDLPKAQEALNESQRLMAVQMGNMRKFMASIMEKSTVARGGQNG